MANTLSQYIGQIIDRRNQELQQRLAPLIPLLQADLAETKAKAEIEKQKQLRIADYGTMADQSFGEGSSAEWLERAKQYQTPEGADAGWKLFASEKGLLICRLSLAAWTAWEDTEAMPSSCAKDRTLVPFSAATSSIIRCINCSLVIAAA